MAELIDKQAAIDAVIKHLQLDCEYAYAVREVINALPSAEPDVPDWNVGDINKFIDGLEEIFADIRESHVDDSVCGLCEYDGAYIGQSGDWCNECPGFDRDDCFKLSDECRKRWIDTITNSLPSAQPEIIRCKDCRWWDKYGDYDNGYCMAAKFGHWSEHWEISIRRTYKGDFYCADAEPKGEQK